MKGKSKGEQEKSWINKVRRSASAENRSKAISTILVQHVDLCVCVCIISGCSVYGGLGLSFILWQNSIWAKHPKTFMWKIKNVNIYWACLYLKWFKYLSEIRKKNCRFFKIYLAATIGKLSAPDLRDLQRKFKINKDPKLAYLCTSLEIMSANWWEKWCSVGRAAKFHM